jgi:hypothetical protein
MARLAIYAAVLVTAGLMWCGLIRLTMWLVASR